MCLVEAQINFVQTYVDDLLTLKQIHSKSLTLVKSVFDPNKVFKLLKNIFL